MKTSDLPAYVQRFFTDRLTSQMRASPNTIASYRDTFRLLLRYASVILGKAPASLAVADIDAEFVADFLTYVEKERGVSVRSRNARLSAIKSFFRYTAFEEPQLMLHCQRILAMPSKQYVKRTIGFLTRTEIEALIAAPDISTRIGRRDRAILLLAMQTGLRVSELINLTWDDVTLTTGAHVRCEGKGRKERATPLRKDCVRMLKSWMKEQSGDPNEPVFTSIRGGKLSRDAVENIVRKYVDLASKDCPTLTHKRVSPHVLRHTAAMELLQNGVDRTVIALWLGHESVETTQMYVHADIEMKEKAMAKTTSVQTGRGRFSPDDKLLSFLEAL